MEVLDHILHDDVQGAASTGRVRFHYVLIDFLCRVTGGTAIGASDALDALWVLRENLGEYQLSARTLQVIEKGFAVFSLEEDAATA